MRGLERESRKAEVSEQVPCCQMHESPLPLRRFPLPEDEMSEEASSFKSLPFKCAFPQCWDREPHSHSSKAWEEMYGNLSSALTATRAELDATKKERDEAREGAIHFSGLCAAYSLPPDSEEVREALAWCEGGWTNEWNKKNAEVLACALRSAQVMIEERQNDVNELVVMNATSKKRAETAEARVKAIEQELDEWHKKYLRREADHADDMNEKHALKAKLDEALTRGEFLGVSKLAERTWNMNAEDAAKLVHEMSARAHAWLNAHPAANGGKP